MSIVLEEVSRTSVLPLHELNRRMVLTSDLGFDSLMLQELEAGLGKRVPGFTTDEMYATGLTVERLITLVDAHGAPAPGAGAPPLRPARTEEDAAQPEPFTSEEPERWSAATARIDDFPEVARFEERADALLRGGADFPYFRVHEGKILDRTVVGAGSSSPSGATTTSACRAIRRSARPRAVRWTGTARRSRRAGCCPVSGS